MASVKRKANQADVGATDVFVTVQTMGGEAALPRGRVSPDTVVGELLQQLRGRERSSWVLLALLLGDRKLAAHERLGDLQARDPKEGLMLTLLRQDVSAELVSRFRTMADNDAGTLKWCVKDHAVRAVAYLMQDPGMNLRRLRLSHSPLTDIAPLAEALRGNTTVEELLLSFTNLSDVKGLAEALRVNSGLQHLSLQGTRVSDVAPLADALRVNRRLRRLTLSSTRVADVDSLGEALQVNRSLRALYLNHTPVTDISALADALRVNRTLRLLSLKGSEVRRVDGLASALQANRALTLLNLGGCPLQERETEELEEVAGEKRPRFRLILDDEDRDEPIAVAEPLVVHQHGLLPFCGPLAVDVTGFWGAFVPW